MSRGGETAQDGSPAPLPVRLRPHGPALFVDRHDQRAALHEAYRATVGSGARHTVFILGEPGIGKTRLVSEFAQALHADGALVVAGRCDADLELPYQPFVEALEHLVAHADDALLAAHLSGHGDRVARLVPALGGNAPSSAHSGESERYLLYSAIEDLLIGAAGQRPLLVVLEDLHWADLPTVRLLRRLLTSPRNGAVLFLATCRSGELERDHPLRALLADLHREQDVSRLELDGLATNDVADLLTGLRNDPSLADALRDNTAGNPFFITELVRNLDEGGAATPDALPVSISETLQQRIGRLGEDVRDVLTTAAAIGDEFDLDLLEAVLQQDGAGAAVDRAVAGDLVVALPGARFRFAHALVQRYLYADLGAAHRTEIHRRIAAALERRLASGAVKVAELAQHAVAGSGSDVDRALRYAELAGEEALEQLAPDEARRWFDVALELAERRPAPRPAERCELLIRRGEAERLAGEPGFRETLLEAGALAAELQDAPALVQAALANTRGMQSETGIVDEDRIALLQQALGAVGPAASPERARLLAQNAAELMYSGRWEEQLRLSGEALQMARGGHDPEALITVLNMRFVSVLAPATHDARRAETSEAITVAEALGDPLARFFAYHWRAGVCLEAGDLDEARGWMDRELEVAHGLREPTSLWLALADRANLALIAGDLDNADRLVQETFAAGQGTEPDAMACFAAQMTCVAFERGTLGDLAPLLQQAVADNPGVPGFRATLALAYVQAGDDEAARGLLAEAAANGFADLAYDVTWLTVACLYAHVSAHLGDTASARRLYDLLLPYRDQLAYPYFGAWGPVELYLGELASALGDEAAVAHLDAAAQVSVRLGATCWAARTEAARAKSS